MENRIKTAQELKKDAVYIKKPEKSLEYLTELIYKNMEKVNSIPTDKKRIEVFLESDGDVWFKSKSLPYDYDISNDILYKKYQKALIYEKPPNITEVRKYFRKFKYTVCTHIYGGASPHVSIEIKW